MKRLCLKNQEATKRGVASLYVVIFATILFGVVTLSFIRIILSEAGNSSDSDLSRSAYDAAVAGVEDAKTAVNRYYSCISSGGGDNCTDDKRSALFQGDCESSIGLARYLYGGSGYSGGEVLLEQTLGGSSNEPDNNADQAYTCVIISDTVPDYRGTLTNDTRTRAVPLNIYDGTNSGSQVTNAKKIRFQWYSALNRGDKQLRVAPNNTTLAPVGDGNISIPPAISLTFIHAKRNVTLEEFTKANNDNPDQLIYSAMTFLPTSLGDQVTEVSRAQIVTEGNVKDLPEGKHIAIATTCNPNATDFSCTVDLYLDRTVAADDNLLLIAALPYGGENTDFVATLLDDGGSPISLTGVQVSVDSTGRTNQLLRRVETRLDPADLFFPYPQYELELQSDEDNNLDKNFWITANCWSSSPLTNGGKAKQCNNNGPVAD